MNAAKAARYLKQVERFTLRGTPQRLEAYRAAFIHLRKNLDERQMIKLITEGPVGVQTLLADLLSDEAFKLPQAIMRDANVRAVIASKQTFAKDIATGSTRTVMGSTFNYLDPNVLVGLAKLDTKVMAGLKRNARESVRRHVEAGLKAGHSPSKIAKGIRDVVSLAPNQTDAVNNFRAMLEAGDRTALTRKLRDRRLDPVFDRLLGSGQGSGPLPPDLIDRAVSSYLGRMEALNAETVAHTATLDAMKLGQRTSIDEAVSLGVYDAAHLVKQWVTVGDDRVRDEHEAMEGEVVRYDEPFSNGQMVPGESDYNCRCIANYFEVEKPPA